MNWTDGRWKKWEWSKRTSNGTAENGWSYFDGNDIWYSEIVLLNDDWMAYLHGKLISKALPRDISHSNVHSLSRFLNSGLRYALHWLRNKLTKHFFNRPFQSWHCLEFFLCWVLFSDHERERRQRQAITGKGKSKDETQLVALRKLFRLDWPLKYGTVELQ
jgi:hypothetical protein